MDPEKIKAALEAIKNGDADAALTLLEDLVAEAAGGEAPSDDAPEGEALAETPEEDEEEDEDEGALAVRSIKRLSGCSSVGAGIARLQRLSDNAKRVEADRRALEADERKALVSSLVKLRAETPATAWANAEAQTPCKRLASEPIAELRARVESLKASHSGAPVPPARRSAASDAGAYEPTETEKKRAANMSEADRAKYFEIRAQRARA